jgi:WD40 repeat protein
VAIYWIPAFAGMTERGPESSDCHPDLLRNYKNPQLVNLCVKLFMWKSIRTMEGHTAWVTSVPVTPDGRYAVSGSDDKTLRLWEFIWDLEFD